MPNLISKRYSTIQNKRAQKGTRYVLGPLTLHDSPGAILDSIMDQGHRPGQGQGKGPGSRAYMTRVQAAQPDFLLLVVTIMRICYY